jgi:hypothetical protein
MINLPRRKFLVGAASLLAAPAVIRVARLMPVRVWKERRYFYSSSSTYLWPRNGPRMAARGQTSHFYVTSDEFNKYIKSEWDAGASSINWTRHGEGGISVQIYAPIRWESFKDSFDLEQYRIAEIVI